MPKAWSAEERQVFDEHHATKTDAEISALLQGSRSPGAVDHYRRGRGVYQSKRRGEQTTETVDPTPDATLAEPDDQIRLALLGNPLMTVAEVCDLVDRGPASVAASVGRLNAAGYRVSLDAGMVALPAPSNTGFVHIPQSHFQDGRMVRFGVLSDVHLCSRYARLDIVTAAYQKFAGEGIREVIVPGNYIDGEAPFNRNDLIVAPGFERQIQYFLKHWPEHEGITTRILDGRDHEGWYSRREGIDIGRRLVQSARDIGRSDLEYLGTSEVDLAFRADDDPASRPAIVRVVHPSGGSSYAISYRPQKIVESYEGGEKPQLLIVGHFHKAGYFMFRNCHVLLAGCAESQTPFMRDKQLAAHTGFYIIEMRVQQDGSITEFVPRFYPFFNEGYYTDKYPIGDLDAVRVA